MNIEHLSPQRLIDYLHGELAPQDDAIVLAHLEACDTCRGEHEREAALTDILRGYARTTERELPSGVVASIWDAVERERSAPNLWDQLRYLFRPAIAIPVAAVFVVGAYFGLTSLRGTDMVPAIDAAYYLNDHAALTRTVPFGEGGTVVPSALASDQTGSDVRWVATTASDVNAPQ